MSLENKMAKLVTQKKKVEQDLMALKDQRALEVGRCVKQIDFQNMASVTIVGMILSALDTASEDKKEVWHKKGQTFCRGKRASKTRTEKPGASLQSAS